MTLIDGDKVVTAHLYDDEYEEWTEEKMSIIDYINAYTDEGVTTADEVLEKIRAEIENDWQLKKYPSSPFSCGLRRAIEIIDKYKGESEEK